MSVMHKYRWENIKTDDVLISHMFIFLGGMNESRYGNSLLFLIELTHGLINKPDLSMEDVVRFTNKFVGKHDFKVADTPVLITSETRAHCIGQINAAKKTGMSLSLGDDSPFAQCIRECVIQFDSVAFQFETSKQYASYVTDKKPAHTLIERVYASYGVPHSEGKMLTSTDRCRQLLPLVVADQSQSNASGEWDVAHVVGSPVEEGDSKFD